MHSKLNVLRYPLLCICILAIGCNTPESNTPHKAEASLPSEDTIAALPKVDTPIAVQNLIKHYDAVIGLEDNYIVFKDGSKLLNDDGKANKTFEELLNAPDIEDQFAFTYEKGKLTKNIDKNQDPGRIRNEAFFKKIYGMSADAVRKNLVEVTWCPTLVNQKIRVTTINGVAEKVKQLSAELDKLPHLTKYIQNIGGTFNWRNIKGSNRLSMHSFGMTIDINTQHSHYWQWDCKCSDENRTLNYKNSIPQEIVEIFEKYGFIWGGKWYHYDTMHFEYRPELL